MRVEPTRRGIAYQQSQWSPIGPCIRTRRSNYLQEKFELYAVNSYGEGIGALIVAGTLLTPCLDLIVCSFSLFLGLSYYYTHEKIFSQPLRTSFLATELARQLSYK